MFLDSESHVDNRLPMGDSDGSVSFSTTKSLAAIETNVNNAETPGHIQVQQDTVAHVITAEDCKLRWKNNTWVLEKVDLTHAQLHLAHGAYPLGQVNALQSPYIAEPNRVLKAGWCARTGLGSRPEIPREPN